MRHTITIAGLIKAGAKANQDINLETMKYTSRLVVMRALARGWSIAHFEAHSAILFIDIPSKGVIQVFSASPPTMSYPSTKIAKNKHVAARVLASVDLPVPEELVAKGTDDPELEAFLKRQGTVVVKPLDLSHGYGVWPGIRDTATLNKAIKAAVNLATSKKALVQKQYGGFDVRVLCINYKYVNAISRIPARIRGDGVHTIWELIEQENKTPDRGENYQTRLNIIDTEKARQYLGEKGIKRVPTAGEEVQVVGISNVGAGGERKNIVNEVPVWMKDMAEKACQALELPVCGVDFLVEHMPTKDATIKHLQPVILEVNQCPMMTMYDDLHSKEQYAVIESYLDYLEQIA